MLPNLIIIGAMKAATTSLHRYLNLHPEISMSAEKEIDFFNKEENFARGLTWYEQHFEEQANVQIYGEASTNYTKYPAFSGVAERIYSVIPQTKLIYILRDPIERTLSHYFMFHARNAIQDTFDELVTNLDRQYIQISCYHRQLQQYLPYFPLDRIHILTSEALKNEPQTTMQRVFQFLEVDDSFDTEHFQTRYNSSAYIKGQNKFGRIAQGLLLNQKSSARKLIMPLVPKKFRRNLRKKLFRATEIELQKPTVSEETRQKLRDYFQPDVDALRELTAMPFDEWSL
jgi:sulfotransferase family protein